MNNYTYNYNDNYNNNYNNNFNNYNNHNNYRNNYVVKESGAADTLRIVFAILACITIGIFTNCLMLGTTFLSGSFWRNTINNSEVRDLLKEEVDISFNDIIQVDNIDSTIVNEDLAEDFIDMVLDEVLDLLLEGDIKVDRERFDDFFDKYQDVIFGDTNLPPAISTKLRDQSFDMFEESLKKYEKEFKSSDAYATMHAFDGFRSWNTSVMIITGVVTAIMVVVLVLIHKNKFRIMRPLGIAMTVAESLNLIGWFLILLLLNALAREANRANEAAEVLVGSMKGSIGLVVLVLFFLLMIGIGLIVGGSIWTKKYDQNAAEQMPMQQGRYY